MNPKHSLKGMKERTIKRPKKISKIEVSLTADSGDLLLFQARGWFTGLQRTVTGSQFDHVAIILRYADSRVVYFESTATTGVALYSWDAFVSSALHEVYAKVSFRKLRC